MTDWAGKLAGAVARLAGILHLAERAGQSEPWRDRISLENVERAITIANYLIPHARAAFAEMGASPDVAAARYLLRWITRTQCESFTKRDAFEGTKGRFKRVEELEPALEVLENHWYVAERPREERAGPGRKASPIYDVNPMALDATNNGDSANTANCAKGVGVLGGQDSDASEGSEDVVGAETSSQYSHYSQNGLGNGYPDAIAPGMRATLLEMGFSEAAVDAMSPEEAWMRLEGSMEAPDRPRGEADGV